MLVKAVFNATALGFETRVGTVPAGSTWRKFPVPTVLWAREGASFEPVCEETEECKRIGSQYQVVIEGMRLGNIYRGSNGRYADATPYCVLHTH
jgi:hypothetical protein